MKYKYIIALSVILILIFSLKTESQEDSEDVKKKNIYKIGSIQSLTGDLSYQGKSMSEAIKLYFDKVNEKDGFNGLDIEIVEYDDGNNPSVALEIAQKLVEKDQVNLIIGGTSVSTALSVMKYIKKEGVPYLHFGGGSVELMKEAGNNVFLLQPSVTMEAMILSQFAYSELYTRNLMVIYQNDDNGFRSRNAVRAYGKVKRLHIVSEVQIKDKKIPYQMIINEVINKKPDTLIILTYMSESNEILKSLRGHQIDVPVILPSYNLDYINIGTIGKSDWNNTYTGRWFKSPKSREVSKFVNTFMENMLTYPNYYHSIGWALSQVVHKSLTSSNYGGSSSKSIKSLYSYDRGITARVDFDNSYNVGIDSMYFVGFQDDNFFENETYFMPDVISYYRESTVMGYLTNRRGVMENLIDYSYKTKADIILENASKIKFLEEEKLGKKNDDNEEDNYFEDEEDSNESSSPISGDDTDRKDIEKLRDGKKKDEKDDSVVYYDNEALLVVGDWKSTSVGDKLKNTIYDGNIYLKLKEDNRYYMSLVYSDKSYVESINGYWEIKDDSNSKRKYILLDQFIPKENLCKAFFKISNYGRSLELIIAEDSGINGGVGLKPDFDNEKLLKPYTITFTRDLPQ